MRILQVIHQFPPYSSQGSEIYCYNLSKYLSQRDEVSVFHVSNTRPRRPFRIVRETHDGLPTFHCVDGGEYSRISDAANHFLRTQFKNVLDQHQPEVVHFHHFVSLGDDLVSMARAHGAAVAYTLHDFGLICPNTLLLRSDGQLCQKADSGFFQDCCPELIRVGTDQWPGATGLPSLARWNRYATQHPNVVARTALRAGVAVALRACGEPSQTNVARKREFFFTHTRRIFQDAQLFLAPSQFLRERYVSCGVPSAKIVYARYGMRRFARLPRRGASNRVVFGYIGALHAQKGVEVLLEAFRGLGDRAELHIHGSAFGSPISQSHWERVHAKHRDQVLFHGTYDNRRIAEILASLDIVVVPSIWYENSPLTIQEAFIGGVPVITSDQGGMAELVRDGVDGLHFRLGDAQSLRAILTRVIEDPQIVDRLRRNIPAVTDIEDEAAGIRARYDALVGPT